MASLSNFRPLCGLIHQRLSRRRALTRQMCPQPMRNSSICLLGGFERIKIRGCSSCAGRPILRAELANVITKALVERYDAAASPEPFSSANIVEIYEKLDALDTTKIDAYLSSLEEGDSYGTPALFALGFDGLEIRNYEEYAGLVPLTLSVKEEEQTRVPVSMRVFFVSADSKNPDAAALYLEAYLRGLSEKFPIVAQAGRLNHCATCGLKVRSSG